MNKRQLFPNNINMARFIAAAMVIYAHSFELIGDKTEPLAMGCSFGELGVEVFFVLSGFLIAMSWNRSANWLSYLVRRIFRILPGLVVVVLLTVFLLGPIVTTLSVNEYFSNSRTWYYLRAMLMLSDDGLPGVFADNYWPNTVNGSLWTLKYEFGMYLILPIIYCICKRVGNSRAIVFSICGLVSAVYVLSTGGFLFILPSAVYQGFRLAAFFMMGTAYYELYDELYISPQWGIAAVALLAFLSPCTRGPFAALCSMLAVFVIVVSFSFCKEPVFGSVFIKNDLSYGLYIYAFPVQQTLILLFGKTISSGLLLTVMAMAITMAFAFLSWRLIEKPAQKFGKELAKSIEKKVGSSDEANAR